MITKILDRWVHYGARHCHHCPAPYTFRRHFHGSHNVALSVDPMTLMARLWMQDGSLGKNFKLDKPYHPRPSDIDALRLTDKWAAGMGYILTNESFSEKRLLNQMIPFIVNSPDC